MLFFNNSARPFSPVGLSNSVCVTSVTKLPPRLFEFPSLFFRARKVRVYAALFVFGSRRFFKRALLYSPAQFRRSSFVLSDTCVPFTESYPEAHDEAISPFQPVYDLLRATVTMAKAHLVTTLASNVICIIAGIMSMALDTKGHATRIATCVSIAASMANAIFTVVVMCCPTSPWATKLDDLTKLVTPEFVGDFLTSQRQAPDRPALTALGVTPEEIDRLAQASLTSNTRTFSDPWVTRCSGVPISHCPGTIHTLAQNLGVPLQGTVKDLLEAASPHSAVASAIYTHLREQYVTLNELEIPDQFLASVLINLPNNDVLNQPLYRLRGVSAAVDTWLDAAVQGNFYDCFPRTAADEAIDSLTVVKRTISLIVAVSACVCMGWDTTRVRNYLTFHQFKKAITETVDEANDLVDWLTLQLFGCTFGESQSHFTHVAEAVKDADRIIATPAADFAKDVRKFYEIRNVYSVLSAASTSLVRSSTVEHTRVAGLASSRMGALLQKQTEAWTLITTQQVRVDPVVIYVHGDPRIGKSTWVREQLIPELATKFGLPPSRYVQNFSGSNFWLPYHGEAFGVFDEALAAGFSDPIVGYVNGMANTTPFNMEGASIETKHQPCNFSIIILIANTPYIPLNQALPHAHEAWWRRCHHIGVSFPAYDPSVDPALQKRADDYSHLKLSWENRQWTGGAYCIPKDRQGREILSIGDTKAMVNHIEPLYVASRDQYLRSLQRQTAVNPFTMVSTTMSQSAAASYAATVAVPTTTGIASVAPPVVPATPLPLTTTTSSVITPIVVPNLSQPPPSFQPSIVLQPAPPNGGVSQGASTPSTQHYVLHLYGAPSVGKTYSIRTIGREIAHVTGMAFHELTATSPVPASATPIIVLCDDWPAQNPTGYQNLYNLLPANSLILLATNCRIETSVTTGFTFWRLPFTAWKCWFPYISTARFPVTQDSTCEWHRFREGVNRRLGFTDIWDGDAYISDHGDSSTGFMQQRGWVPYPRLPATTWLTWVRDCFRSSTIYLSSHAASTRTWLEYGDFLTRHSDVVLHEVNILPNVTDFVVDVSFDSWDLARRVLCDPGALQRAFISGAIGLVVDPSCLPRATALQDWVLPTSALDRCVNGSPDGIISLLSNLRQLGGTGNVRVVVGGKTWIGVGSAIYTTATSTMSIVTRSPSGQVTLKDGDETITISETLLSAIVVDGALQVPFPSFTWCSRIRSSRYLFESHPQVTTAVATATIAQAANKAKLAALAAANQQVVPASRTAWFKILLSICAGLTLVLATATFIRSLQGGSPPPPSTAADESQEDDEKRLRPTSQLSFKARRLMERMAASDNRKMPKQLSKMAFNAYESLVKDEGEELPSVNQGEDIALDPYLPPLAVPESIDGVALTTDPEVRLRATLLKAYVTVRGTCTVRGVCIGDNTILTVGHAFKDNVVDQGVVVDDGTYAYTAQVHCISPSRDLAIVKVTHKAWASRKNIRPLFMKNAAVNTVVQTRFASVEDGCLTIFECESNVHKSYFLDGATINSWVVSNDFVSFTNKPTTAGSCGFMYYARDKNHGDRMLMGMHAAASGSGRTSYAALTTQEVIASLENSEAHEESAPSVGLLPNSDALMDFDYQKHFTTPVTKYLEGTPLTPVLETRHPEYPPFSKDKFKLSPWVSVLQTSTLSAPSVKSPTQVRNVSELKMNGHGKLDIALSQAVKYAGVDAIPNGMASSYAEEATIAMMHNTYGTPKLSPVSWHEALNGLTDDPGALSHIDLTTSAGHRSKVIYGATKKSDLLARGDDGKIHFTNSDFRAFCARVDMSAAQGRRYFLPYVDKLKTELLPLEKVKNGGTRLFCAGDAAEFIVLRRVFTPIIALLHNGRFSSSLKIGIDPLTEYTDLVRDLRTYGPVGIEGDFKRFDKNLPKWVIAIAFKALKGFYSVDVHPYLDWAEATYTETYHILNSSVYQTHRGTPSGHLLTSVVNTIAHYALHAYVIADLHYKEHDACPSFCPQIYCGAVFHGDDGVIVPTSVGKFLTPTAVAASLSATGLVYKVTSTSFLPIGKLSFLKRSLGTTDFVVLPALAGDSIVRTLHYGSSDRPHDIVQRLNAALNDAAMHDITFFDSVETDVNAILDFLNNAWVNNHTARISYDDRRIVLRAAATGNHRARTLACPVTYGAGFAHDKVTIGRGHPLSDQRNYPIAGYENVGAFIQALLPDSASSLSPNDRTRISNTLMRHITDSAELIDSLVATAGAPLYVSSKLHDQARVLYRDLLTEIRQVLAIKILKDTSSELTSNPLLISSLNSTPDTNVSLPLIPHDEGLENMSINDLHNGFAQRNIHPVWDYASVGTPDNPTWTTTLSFIDGTVPEVYTASGPTKRAGQEKIAQACIAKGYGVTGKLSGLHDALGKESLKITHDAEGWTCNFRGTTFITTSLVSMSNYLKKAINKRLDQGDVGPASMSPEAPSAPTSSDNPAPLSSTAVDVMVNQLVAPSTMLAMGGLVQDLRSICYENDILISDTPLPIIPSQDAGSEIISVGYGTSQFNSYQMAYIGMHKRYAGSTSHTLNLNASASFTGSLIYGWVPDISGSYTAAEIQSYGHFGFISMTGGGTATFVLGDSRKDSFYREVGDVETSNAGYKVQVYVALNNPYGTDGATAYLTVTSRFVEGDFVLAAPVLTSTGAVHSAATVITSLAGYGIKHLITDGTSQDGPIPVDTVPDFLHGRPFYAKGLTMQSNIRSLSNVKTTPDFVYDSIALGAFSLADQRAPTYVERHYGEGPTGVSPGFLIEAMDNDGAIQSHPISNEYHWGYNSDSKTAYSWITMTEDQEKEALEWIKTVLPDEASLSPIVAARPAFPFVPQRSWSTYKPLANGWKRLSRSNVVATVPTGWVNVGKCAVPDYYAPDGGWGLLQSSLVARQPTAAAFDLTLTTPMSAGSIATIRYLVAEDIWVIAFPSVTDLGYASINYPTSDITVRSVTARKINNPLAVSDPSSFTTLVPATTVKTVKPTSMLPSAFPLLPATSASATDQAAAIAMGVGSGLEAGGKAWWQSGQNKKDRELAKWLATHNNQNRVDVADIARKGQIGSASIGALGGWGSAYINAMGGATIAGINNQGRLGQIGATGEQARLDIAATGAQTRKTNANTQMLNLQAQGLANSAAMRDWSDAQRPTPAARSVYDKNVTMRPPRSADAQRPTPAARSVYDKNVTMRPPRSADAEPPKPASEPVSLATEDYTATEAPTIATSGKGRSVAPASHNTTAF
eukprot:548840_1